MAVLPAIAAANATAMAKARTMFGMSLPWRRRHSSLVEYIIIFRSLFALSSIESKKRLAWRPTDASCQISRHDRPLSHRDARPGRGFSLHRRARGRRRSGPQGSDVVSLLRAAG